MRKALIVGIDYYQNVTCLKGCVNDAYSVKSVLERHGDGSVNFGVNIKTASNSSTTVTRRELKDAVQELFCDDSENSAVLLLWSWLHRYYWGLPHYL